jgi:hypothetical protein
VIDAPKGTVTTRPNRAPGSTVSEQAPKVRPGRRRRIGEMPNLCPARCRSWRRARGASVLHKPVGGHLRGQLGAAHPPLVPHPVSLGHEAHRSWRCAQQEADERVSPVNKANPYWAPKEVTPEQRCGGRAQAAGFQVSR